MRNYFSFLFATTLLITTAPCFTMNEITPTKKPIILTEILNIKTKQMGFLDNNRIIINSTKICSVFDAKTGKEIRKIIDQPAHLAIHPNRSLFAISDHQFTFLIDAKNFTFINDHQYETADENENICPSIFIAPFNNYFIRINNVATDTGTGSTFTDYINNVSESYKLKPQSVTFHPIEQNELCCMYSNDDMMFYNYNIQNHELKYLSSIENDRKQNSLFFCQYSPDGSHLITADDSTIDIIDLKFNTAEVITASAYGKPIKSVAIHPHSSAITILMGNHNRISCYDLKTKKRICIIATFGPDSQDYKCTPEDQHLAFSPDGETLLVALENRCVIVPVPLIAMCTPQMRERIILIHFLLCHYHFDQCNKLPFDIIQLLTHNLFEVLRHT